MSEREKEGEREIERDLRTNRKKEKSVWLVWLEIINSDGSGCETGAVVHDRQKAIGADSIILRERGRREE